MRRLGLQSWSCGFDEAAKACFTCGRRLMGRPERHKRKRNVRGAVVNNSTAEAFFVILQEMTLEQDFKITAKGCSAKALVIRDRKRVQGPATIDQTSYRWKY